MKLRIYLQNSEMIYVGDATEEDVEKLRMSLYDDCLYVAEPKFGFTKSELRYYDVEA